MGICEHSVGAVIVPTLEPEAEPKRIGELATRILRTLATEAGKVNIEIDAEVAGRLRERAAEEGLEAEEIARQGLAVWSQLRGDERHTIGFAAMRLIMNRRFDGDGRRV